MDKETFDVVILCLRLIQSTAAVVLNMLTIVCVLRYRSLRNTAGMLVASLALTDTLHGLAMYTLPLRNLSNTTCIISLAAETFTVNVQLLSLSMLAMERHNSLRAQLNHAHKWSVKMAGSVLIGGWTFFVIWNVAFTLIIPSSQDGQICMLRNQFPTFYVFANVSFVLISVLTVAIFYTCIARIALSSLPQVLTHAPNTSQQRRRWIRELQITKMMAMVVGVFAILYTPGLISVAFMPKSPPFWRHVVHNLTLVMYDGIFWSNPAMYAWRNKQFRQAFRSMFSGCRLCRTTDDNPAVHINVVAPAVGTVGTAAPPLPSNRDQALVPRQDVITNPPLNVQALLGRTSSSFATRHDSHDLPRVD